jgi:hypothetical protein
MFYFYSKSPLLDVGGFAKQGIKKYSPYYGTIMFFRKEMLPLVVMKSVVPVAGPGMMIGRLTSTDHVTKKAGSSLWKQLWEATCLWRRHITCAVGVAGCDRVLLSRMPFKKNKRYVLLLMKDVNSFQFGPFQLQQQGGPHGSNTPCSIFYSGYMWYRKEIVFCLEVKCYIL